MNKTNLFVTRFAPSPTGYLHLGHAYSALQSYNAAKEMGGRFILRIEDIDPTRCKEEYIKGIEEDLEWLGLSWELPVRRQSEHIEDYQKNLDILKKKDLVYPCFCTRSSIAKEISQSAQAPHTHDGEQVYPQTCKRLTSDERAEKLAMNQTACWRLDMEKACSAIENAGHRLTWHDAHKGEIKADPRVFGDIVLARKETPTSYHLSVTTDDAIQGITTIIRGEDLFLATDIHCLLQKLLDLPTPNYCHHPLLKDEKGVRFAKRDQSLTLRALRNDGYSAEAIRERIQQTLLKPVQDLVSAKDFWLFSSTGAQRTLST